MDTCSLRRLFVFHRLLFWKGQGGDLQRQGAETGGHLQGPRRHDHPEHFPDCVLERGHPREPPRDFHGKLPSAQPDRAENPRVRHEAVEREGPAETGPGPFFVARRAPGRDGIVPGELGLRLFLAKPDAAQVAILRRKTPPGAPRPVLP